MPCRHRFFGIIRRWSRRTIFSHRRLGPWGVGPGPAALSPARALLRPTRPMPTRWPKVTATAAVLAGLVLRRPTARPESAAFQGARIFIFEHRPPNPPRLGGCRHATALAWGQGQLGNRPPSCLSASDTPEPRWKAACRRNMASRKSSHGSRDHMGGIGQGPSVGRGPSGRLVVGGAGENLGRRGSGAPFDLTALPHGP